MPPEMPTDHGTSHGRSSKSSQLAKSNIARTCIAVHNHSQGKMAMRPKAFDVPVSLFKTTLMGLKMSGIGHGPCLSALSPRERRRIGD